MMTQYYHLGIQTNYTLPLYFISSLLCSHYVADLIKKLELLLMVVKFYLRLNLGTPKLVCPKSVYDAENSPYQPLIHDNKTFII